VDSSRNLHSQRNVRTGESLPFMRGDNGRIKLVHVNAADSDYKDVNRG
jgi:hypothetical protein